MATAPRTPEHAWLGVVSADHVRYAVEHGIVQINHGKRHNLTRLQRGDGFVYYSPTQHMGDKTPLRAFTALGLISDDEPYLAEPMQMGAAGSVRPWRRRVELLATRAAPLQEVKDRLDLTQDPNWGYRLRAGLVALPVEDFETLRAVMGA